MSVGVAHKIPGSLYIILGHTLRSKCPGGASGGEPGSASKSAEGARYEILPATLERAACQPLLNAALADAAVNKPLLFFFLRELIWYYGDIVS